MPITMRTMDLAAYRRAMHNHNISVYGAVAVAQRRRPTRWFRLNLPMVTLKDDDPQITWDHKAMAARPFRERKD